MRVKMACVKDDMEVLVMAAPLLTSGPAPGLGTETLETVKCGSGVMGLESTWEELSVVL